MPAFYTINFCLNQGPDVIPPIVKLTDPKPDTLLSYNATERYVEVYTNEPSDCRYSENSEDTFEEMTLGMTCPSSIQEISPYGYKCSATVPIEKTKTELYFKCKDQPWLEGTENASNRNEMTEPHLLTLEKVSSPIEITTIAPTEDFETNTLFKTLTYSLKTANGGRDHTCFYYTSTDPTEHEFYSTHSTEHSQERQHHVGNHEIFFKCEDETGDSATASTKFEIIYDENQPKVTRVFVQGSQLFLYTDEPSTCFFTNNGCSFTEDEAESMGTGEEHSTPHERGETYYIKCKDEWGNLPSGCSITVSPSE